MKATDALDTLQELAGSAPPEERSAFDRLMKRVEDAGSQRMSWEQLLGASLYEATAADAHYRAGREALYEGIAASDAEIERCVEEARGIVAELEARRAAERAAAEASHLAAMEQDGDGPCTCPFCGTAVEPENRFCGGCGRPASEVRAEVAARRRAEQEAAATPAVPTACPRCGEPLVPDAVFCIACGCNIAEAQAAAKAGIAADASAEAPAPGPGEPGSSDVADASSAQPVCPSCGKPVDDDDLFCMECGTKLK